MLGRWMVTGLVLCWAGCAPQKREREPEPVEQSVSPPSAESSSMWAPYVGQCVVVSGYFAGGAKTGPRLVMGGRPLPGVDLELADADERIEGGARVEVRGTITRRHDRPVFVHREGQPAAQGIPVPEGTDLEKARMRYLLAGATVRVLREPGAVNEQLGAKVGQRVELSGRLWSRNSHWWFNHDGVDLHLDDLANIAGWEPADARWNLHGETMVVVGPLDRRPMPRIDQITLTPDREIAEAFVVKVEQSKPHPIAPVEPCR